MRFIQTQSYFSLKTIFLVLSLISNYFICAQNLDSLIISASKTSNKIEKANIYNNISNLYLDLNIYEALKYADSAMYLGKSINNYKIISNAYVNYGNYYFFQGNLDSTLYFFKKSFEEIKKSNDQNEIASSINRLGLIYEAKSNYREAVDYYYQALKIYEETNYKQGLANIYNNLGVIFDIQKNTEKAILKYNKALTLFTEINDADGQANVYNNLATIYANNNELTKAIAYINISIDLLVKNNRKAEAATALYNASTFYEKAELNDSARQALDMALEYFKSTNNLHGIGNVYDKEAELLTKKNKYSEAIVLLKTSLAIRKEVGNLSALAETTKKIADIYIKINDYKNGYNHFKDYTELNDSIFNISSKKAISELNIKYETETKDKEIAILKKSAEIKKFQNSILIIVVIAFATISILLLYTFKTKNRLLTSQKKYFAQKEELNKLEILKQKTERELLQKEITNQQRINELQKNKFESELEHSKRELATSTIQILNKNTILAEIKESISLLNTPNQPEKNKLKIITEKISDNINLDSDWEQFKIHFEKVNINFFEKLQNQYPELSQGDLKVCAYIKINLSPKEIAQMMNISIAGINKRLYRIRKKQ